MPSVSRRRVLSGAAATLTAAAVAACDPSRRNAPAPTTGTAPRSAAGTDTSSSRGSGPGTGPSAGPRGGPATGATGGPRKADWRALAASLDGDLVSRFAPDYAEVKQLFNTRFDHARPVAVVEAAGPADVSETILFAQRFGLRSRPRAGGHSYVGASTLDDGLVIDVRRMRAIRYDPAGRVATVGAGAQLYAMHAALARHGRSIPTGTCPTVGATGLTLGGGLGIDNRAHGLTCDALTGLTMVTADGTVRRIGPGREGDLWWATRGGGGGNFGVVTSLSYRTHAARPIGVFLVSFRWDQAGAVLRGWAARARSMPRSAWCNLHLEAGADGSTGVRIVGACSEGDQDAQVAAMERAVGLEATSVSTFGKAFMDGVRYFAGGTTSSRQAFVAGSDVVARMSRTLSLRCRASWHVGRRAAGHR